MPAGHAIARAPAAVLHCRELYASLPAASLTPPAAAPHYRAAGASALTTRHVQAERCLLSRQRRADAASRLRRAVPRRVFTPALSCRFVTPEPLPALRLPLRLSPPFCAAAAPPAFQIVITDTTDYRYAVSGFIRQNDCV